MPLRMLMAAYLVFGVVALTRMCMIVLALAIFLRTCIPQLMSLRLVSRGNRLIRVR